MVPHVRQRLKWDCGLACVEMVLRAINVDASAEGLREQVGTSNVWTIDLAFLLVAYRVFPRYCTLQLGCNPGFSSEAFYSTRLSDDRERVEHLFARALTCNVPCVEERSLSRPELCAYLQQGRTVAIVLVDRRYLYPVLSIALAAEQAETLSAEATDGTAGAATVVSRLIATLNTILPSAMQPGSSSLEDESHAADASARLRSAVGDGGFIGHFVLLLGLSKNGDAYVVHDPARECGLDEVPCDDFDRARRAFGTDEDVILIQDARLPERILC